MTTTTKDLTKAIEASGLVGRRDFVLAAVSGGADSMALLHVLHRWRPEGLAAAHFDHGIRGDGGRVRELVAAFCAERGVACHCGAGDAPARARAEGESLEEAARKLRYEFFEDTADRVGADRIATAHTFDDQVETVLMRIMRGSGVRGTAGIPQRRGRFVRPLLRARRSDVLAYCRAWNVPFVDDPTNTDARFERNRIRHRVLPALRSVLADADERLAVVADQSAAILRSIRATTTPIVARHLVREDAGVWRLPVEPLRALDATALYVLFADVIADAMGCDADAGRYHYESLARLVREGRRTGAIVSLPGVEARLEHDGLVFSRRVPRPREADRSPAAETAIPGATEFSGRSVRCDLLDAPARRADVRAVRAGVESGGRGRPAVAYFARESLVPPLRVRRWEAGDRMQPFGMEGRKKLSDIFIDRKVPRRKRSDFLVVEDAREIVWLVGVTTSESTRVSDASKAMVRVTVEGRPPAPANPPPNSRLKIR